ncbi:MAG TPA: monofunctional biosynthetic peptidoglycan transglycosylase [Bryobacteraceae bacterium]|nr:monofunctional biosynthetic peptidoglycan transglycosylase [Bryobacteraceae bacterium]
MFRLIGLAIAVFIGFYVVCLLCLVGLKWINPITTAVQGERRVKSRRAHQAYKKRYTFVPLSQISRDLQHAVIAAEDGRFYQHYGFDWVEVHKVLDQDLETGTVGRGASTITQQLVKNLFLTTSRSTLRKAIEASLVYPTEFVLGKQRILELYLNVIEWGPGVYGAEAASEFWYHVPAARVDRDEAARLAAIIPSPSRRKPARMNDYSAAIEERMRQMGW